IRKEVAAGRQAYIICPAIEAAKADEGELSEAAAAKAEMKNVIDYTTDLCAALPDINIAYLHGKMKPGDKQDIMDRFKAGEIHVLVSTTVIEVGVHVANATLMIIENAERFGLSQLHQLRGRVGRGSHQSYCVLITDTKGDETKQRMKAMCDTADGFILAELDLKLRGAGDFFGTRQHGLPSFAIANLYRDMGVLKEAQEAAEALADADILPAERESIGLRIAKVLDATHGGVM
ncbi:MAG: ATP-dependent DNA helicase RecG, partial [Defluviitaleaceae bacterium]|nr:ATP-dependent DNA helicase RecG [Defluviitaleaceae bacterium]